MVAFRFSFKFVSESFWHSFPTFESHTSGTASLGAASMAALTRRIWQRRSPWMRGICVRDSDTMVSVIHSDSYGEGLVVDVLG